MRHVHANMQYHLTLLSSCFKQRATTEAKQVRLPTFTIRAFIYGHDT